MLLRLTILFLLVFSSIMTLFAQSNDKVNFLFRENQFYMNGLAKSMISIKRNADNPLLPLQDVVYEHSLNDNFKTLDNLGNAISAAELEELMTVVDTSVVIDMETYEESIVITKNFLSGANLDGCELNIELNIKNEKIESKLIEISPFILNGKQNRVQKLYTIVSSNGCNNPDYGYLIQAKLNKDKHPEIRDYLFDVLYGKLNISKFDSKLKPLSTDQLEDNLYQTDTSTVIDYNTYEESVTVTRSEVHREDMDLNILGELTFCSQSRTFDFSLKAIGCSYDVFHPKTSRMIENKIVFLIKVD